MMLYENHLVYLNHEGDVASVTFDIVDSGSIAFVEEGITVLDKILEASLFFLSDVELML